MEPNASFKKATSVSGTMLSEDKLSFFLLAPEPNPSRLLRETPGDGEKSYANQAKYTYLSCMHLSICDTFHHWHAVCADT